MQIVIEYFAAGRRSRRSHEANPIVLPSGVEHMTRHGTEHNSIVSIGSVSRMSRSQDPVFGGVHSIMAEAEIQNSAISNRLLRWLVLYLYVVMIIEVTTEADRW